MGRQEQIFYITHAATNAEAIMIFIPVLVQLLHFCILGDFDALYNVITQVIYNTSGYDDVTQVVIHMMMMIKMG